MGGISGRVDDRGRRNAPHCSFVQLAVSVRRLLPDGVHRERDRPLTRLYTPCVPLPNRGGWMSRTEAATARDTGARLWWVRPGLEVRGGRLEILGRDAGSLAREHGTPLYVYDAITVEARVRALQAAFERADLPGRVRFAL